TGFDLRDAIVEKFPDLRTVFTSRYDLTGFEEAINGCALVYEPVPTTKLVRAVCGPSAEPAGEGKNDAVVPALAQANSEEPVSLLVEPEAGQEAVAVAVAAPTPSPIRTAKPAPKPAPVPVFAAAPAAAVAVAPVRVQPPMASAA